MTEPRLGLPSAHHDAVHPPRPRPGPWSSPCPTTPGAWSAEVAAPSGGAWLSRAGGGGPAVGAPAATATSVAGGPAAARRRAERPTCDASPSRDAQRCAHVSAAADLHGVGPPGMRGADSSDAPRRFSFAPGSTRRRACSTGRSPARDVLPAGAAPGLHRLWRQGPTTGPASDRTGPDGSDARGRAPRPACLSGLRGRAVRWCSQPMAVVAWLTSCWVSHHVRRSEAPCLNGEQYISLLLPLGHY